MLRQTCLNIYWHCRACGNRHPLEDFPEKIDDDLETRLANIRCNRI